MRLTFSVSFSEGDINFDHYQHLHQSGKEEKHGKIGEAVVSSFYFCVEG